MLPGEQLSRRGALRLYSFGQVAVLAELLAGDSSDGSMDGRTIVNSILGAYGLPKLKASPGYRWVLAPAQRCRPTCMLLAPRPWRGD